MVVILRIKHRVISLKVSRAKKHVYQAVSVSTFDEASNQIISQRANPTLYAKR